MFPLLANADSEHLVVFFPVCLFRISNLFLSHTLLIRTLSGLLSLIRLSLPLSSPL